jgi:hypothetical protein
MDREEDDRRAMNTRESSYATVKAIFTGARPCPRYLAMSAATADALVAEYGLAQGEACSAAG